MDSKAIVRKFVKMPRKLREAGDLLIDSGLYNNMADIIRDGLRMIHEEIREQKELFDGDELDLLYYTIQLSKESEVMFDKILKSGKYATVSEIIRDAIRKVVDKNYDHLKSIIKR